MCYSTKKRREAKETTNRIVERVLLKRDLVRKTGTYCLYHVHHVVTLDKLIEK
jgi:hypothetical protein